MKKINRGLTLIEVVVVIAILGIILVLGSIVNLDSYKGTIFRSERSVMVSYLSKARNRSINNISASRWGLCYDQSDPANPKYFLFQGNTYASAVDKEPLKATPTVVITPLTSPFICSVGPGVVFDQLSGKLYPQLTPATNELSINVTQDARTSDIKINNEGRISW